MYSKVRSRDSGSSSAIFTRPSASRPPVHYHPHQEERFEVLSGKLNALIDGRERTLRTGGVHVNWQTRPALKTEAFFEMIWGLANDGKTNEKGAPNLLQMAVVTQEYEE